MKKYGVPRQSDIQELSHLINSETKQIEPPYHRFSGRKPIIFTYFDDCQSTPIMNNNRVFNNLCNRHRHTGSFHDEVGALGTSMIITAQSWRAVGGVPKTVRSNCTLLCLFKTHSKKQFNEIAEETSSEISPDVFKNIYEKATVEDHSFLTVDFQPKRSYPVFRKRFEEPINIDS